MLRSKLADSGQRTADRDTHGRFSCRLSAVRCPLLFVLFATFTHAAILPEMLGDYARGPAKELAAPDPALGKEYGFEAAEQADYTAAQGSFHATAWRYHDPTGAMAALQSQRPGSPGGDMQLLGNYVLLFTPKAPGEAELAQLHALLPRLDESPLPVLKDYLPVEGLIPDSARYVVGPVSLARFEPRISSSLAAFHLSAEAQLGRYSTPKGPMTLAIFGYPTPNIARQRFEEFQKMPGAVAKRTGTLVAVTIDPPDPNAAEDLLAKIVYQQNITWNEKVPENVGRQIGGIFLGSFALAGGILVACLVGGIGMGTLRILLRKMGWNIRDPDQMIVFHLDQRADK